MRPGLASTTSAFLFVFLGASFLECARAGPLTGQIAGRLDQFSGTIDALDLVLDGNPVNTGTITYTLDLDADPADQWIIYDFDAMTQSYGVDLLVSAPLLVSLGQPDQKIRVVFSGDITDITPADFTPGVFTPFVITAGPLHGGGVFGPGQLFSGWEYSNIQITVNTGDINVEVGNPKIEVKDNSININGTNQGTFKSPDGTQTAPIRGTGTAHVTTSAIPEPSTLVLSAIGSLTIGVWRFRPSRRSPA